MGTLEIHIASRGGHVRKQQRSVVYMVVTSLLVASIDVDDVLPPFENKQKKRHPICHQR
jgi:hypothetical protein